MLGGARLAVNTARRLFLLDPAAAKARALGPVKHAGGPVVSIFDGAALLVETSRWWRLDGLADSVVKRLGGVSVPVRFDFEHEGRIFMQGAGEHFELVGARAAVERFAGSA